VFLKHDHVNDSKLYRILKISILGFLVSVLEVAIGEYGITLDKLVAAAETLEADQKSVALTTALEESKVALFLETLFPS